MTDNTERVTFRITPNQAEAIDEIMMRYSHKTRSQVIRAAIENLINDAREEWNTKKIVIHVPKYSVVRLDNAVEDGFAVTREELLNKALDEYLLKVEKIYNEGWETYKQSRMAFKKAIDTNPSITKSQDTIE